MLGWSLFFSLVLIAGKNENITKLDVIELLIVWKHIWHLLSVVLLLLLLLLLL